MAKPKDLKVGPITGTITKEKRPATVWSPHEQIRWRLRFWVGGKEVLDHLETFASRKLAVDAWESFVFAWERRPKNDGPLAHLFSEEDVATEFVQVWTKAADEAEGERQAEEQAEWDSY